MKSIRLFFLLALALPLACLTGCSTSRFVAAYALDPKPPRSTYDDLKPAANPQPVALSFDMHNADGPFAEGTQKFASKIARVVEASKLFSGVAKVSSEKTARLKITLNEMATVSGLEVKKLPPGLTSGLPGSEAAVLYMFSASYQPAGRPPVNKVYHQAIHVLNSKTGWQLNELPLTGGQAADAMIEQLTLNFLRDLQREGKL